MEKYSSGIVGELCLAVDRRGSQGQQAQGGGSPLPHKNVVVVLAGWVC